MSYSLEEDPYQNPEETGLIVIYHPHKPEAADYAASIHKNSLWPYGPTMPLAAQHDPSANREQLEQVLQQGPADVIIAGGDGTISNSIKALLSLGHEGKIAVSAFGNANDTAKMLHSPYYQQKPLEALLHGYDVYVPTIDIRANQQKLIAIAYSGVGLTAECSAFFNSPEYRNNPLGANQLLQYARKVKAIDKYLKNYDKFLRYINEGKNVLEIFMELDPLILSNDRHETSSKINDFTIINGFRMAKTRIHPNPELLTSPQALYEFTRYRENSYVNLFEQIKSFGKLAIGRHVLTPDKRLDFSLESVNDRPLILHTDGEIVTLQDKKVDMSVSLGEYRVRCVSTR